MTESVRVGKAMHGSVTDTSSKFPDLETAAELRLGPLQLGKIGPNTEAGRNSSSEIRRAPRADHFVRAGPGGFTSVGAGHQQKVNGDSCASGLMGQAWLNSDSKLRWATASAKAASTRSFMLRALLDGIPSRSSGDSRSCD